MLLSKGDSSGREGGAEAGEICAAEDCRAELGVERGLDDVAGPRALEPPEAPLSSSSMGSRRCAWISLSMPSSRWKRCSWR